MLFEDHCASWRNMLNALFTHGARQCISEEWAVRGSDFNLHVVDPDIEQGLAYWINSNRICY
jgi:hypothetical protein